MKTSTEIDVPTMVAATVAGEDIHCGDYLALLNIVCEVPSYLWDTCQTLLPAQEVVRLRLIPSDAGVPLKVFAVCLPFVYAKDTSGDVKTLDLRRQQVVRLNLDCAKEVWDELKRAKKRN